MYDTKATQISNWFKCNLKMINFLAWWVYSDSRDNISYPRLLMQYEKIFKQYYTIFFENLSLPECNHK